MFFENIEHKTNGRGIIIYVDKCLQATPYQANVDYCESAWVTINSNKINPLLIGCIYRSPNCTVDNELNLFRLLNEISNLRSTQIIIAGDFNYPEIDWNNWQTPNEGLVHGSGAFIECLRDSFFYQHVTQPTRGRQNNEPHILDLIITRTEDELSDLEYESPLGMSDHSVLRFNVNYNNTIDIQEKWRFIYDKADYDAMNQSLQIDWDNEFVNCRNDVNGMYSIFLTKINEAITNYIPKRKIVSGNQSKKRLALEPGTTKLIRKKHRLWNRYIEKRDDESFVKYKKMRNEVRNLTRLSVRRAEKSVAREAKQNPKKFWSYVKSKTKRSTKTGELMTVDDSGKEVLTKSDAEKAEVLTKFFASVFTLEPAEDCPKLLDRVVETEMGDIKFEETSVLNKLLKLNPNKSPGPDNLHPRVLRELAHAIYRPLTAIFNTSIKSAVIPDEWKQANISAIFKKGSKKDPGNYRPISLTSIVVKLLESLIRDEIVKHMLTNKLFSDKQFGFMGGRSTTLQLLYILENWTKSLDEGGFIDVIYTDFQKAFDTVPHRRLLGKLHSYGINEGIIKWVESFLSNRKQRVNINGSSSSWQNVLSGVPQGSVLGPLLFVIFINDLPEQVDSLLYLFADDAKMFQNIVGAHSETLLQNDLLKIQQWTESWMLKLNLQKCKHLTIGNAKGRNVNYFLKDKMSYYTLENVDNEKDLGVIMDSKLGFDNHINEKINKANGIIAVIKYNFKYIDAECLLLLYKALVRPHLEYAVRVWAPYKNKHVIALENVQRRATRLVPSLRNLSYENRLRCLKLPTLVYRRLRGDMIEVYKLLTGKYDNELPPLLELQGEGSITRGHKLKLKKQMARTNIRSQFFTLRVVNHWNSLPDWVVDSPSLISFEKNLDKCWMNAEFEYSLPL